MMVMGGAVLLTFFPTWYLSNKPGTKACCDENTMICTGKSLWQRSMEEKIDLPLVLGKFLPYPVPPSLLNLSRRCWSHPTVPFIPAGSSIFGVGWGLGGVCPGPGMVLFVVGYPKIVLGFLPSMTLGMALHSIWVAKKSHTSSCSSAKKTTELNKCVVSDGDLTADAATRALDENLAGPVLESPSLRQRRPMM